MLNIENPGFQDFRADASCTIRPQALIGEKYVDCLPTQPRVEGTPLPPPLQKIPSGREGAGQYLLPRAEHLEPGRRRPARRHPAPARTRALHDHPQRTRRRPRRARQRPQRSHQARQPGPARTRQGARRSSPTRTTCSRNSPSTPTRRSPRSRGCAGSVADFIVQSNTVSQAGAATRGSLARNLALFPPFLEQLGPALERVQRFAEQTTPTFTDLKVAAPGHRQGVHEPARRSRRAPKSSSRTSARPRRSPAPRSTASGRCSNSLRSPRQRRAAVHEQLLPAVREPARNRRPRADHGLHLPRHRRGQRLRRAGPLPARRGRRQRCLDVRSQALLGRAAAGANCSTTQPLPPQREPRRPRPRAVLVLPARATRARAC